MVMLTKIVVTVGPASGDAQTLRGMVEAGCDVFRVNFSHGDEEQREAFLENIRRVEAETGEPLGVMADLCGPKIRVGLIHGGAVLLAEGQEITIQRDPIEGRADRLSTTLAELVDQVSPGERILLDEGRISLVVLRIDPPEEFVCQVVSGGILASGKGVNLPQTNLALPALTEKDRDDVAWILDHGFDYIALSFVRSAADLAVLRELFDGRSDAPAVVAKIEKPQAMEHIEAIIDSADAIMVARGDLGIEMDLPTVPIAQKRIARLCQRAGKPCIIATQMLETMTHAPMPTRAEVSDVANAVLDCADAVMLSGETAVGEYPVRTVDMMNRIVGEAERSCRDETAPGRVVYAAGRTVAALAGAVRGIIEDDDIAAVAVFTATGTTARILAKSRLPCPILAMSQHITAVRRMCLYYGVSSVRADAPAHTRDILELASDVAKQRGLAKSGEKIIVVSGRPIGQPGKTNTLVVHTVS